MQHPMMRAAEPEFLQHVVGVGDEVPVGKEQKLDQVPHRLALAGRAAGLGSTREACITRKNYVSHIDIFRFDCYSKARFRERIVPRTLPWAGLSAGPRRATANRLKHTGT
jgi:hypothetical protein